MLFSCFLFSTLYVLSLLHNEIVMTSNYKRNVSGLTFKRATLEIVCESEVKVNCGQVWCPILGFCALHITHPSAHTE